MPQGLMTDNRSQQTFNAWRDQMEREPYRVQAAGAYDRARAGTRPSSMLAPNAGTGGHRQRMGQAYARRPAMQNPLPSGPMFTMGQTLRNMRDVTRSAMPASPLPGNSPWASAVGTRSTSGSPTNTTPYADVLSKQQCLKTAQNQISPDEYRKRREKMRIVVGALLHGAAGGMLGGGVGSLLGHTGKGVALGGGIGALSGAGVAALSNRVRRYVGVDPLAREILEVNAGG